MVALDHCIDVIVLLPHDGMLTAKRFGSALRSTLARSWRVVCVFTTDGVPGSDACVVSGKVASAGRQSGCTSTLCRIASRLHAPGSACS